MGNVGSNLAIPRPQLLSKTEVILRKMNLRSDDSSDSVAELHGDTEIQTAKVDEGGGCKVSEVY